MSDNPSGAAPVRLRSRFPKAQPKIAGPAAGIARIRRLSGHAAIEDHESHHKPETAHPVAEQKITEPEQKQIEIERPVEAEKVDDTAGKSEEVVDNLLVDKLVVKEAEKPVETVLEALSVNPPDIDSTTSQSSNHSVASSASYTPRFSKEHITYIIKHRSLQKLKKIESETLREKRKSYKSTLQLKNNENDQLQIDRSKVRMRDLLYYNPKHNAMKKPLNEVTITNEQLLEQQSVTSEERDDHDEVRSVRSEVSVSVSVSTPLEEMSAPQLKFAEDGTIILNEESLVINRRQSTEIHFDETVIENDQNDNLTYNSYRKFHHTRKWTQKETVKFYKALSMVGTDFTMIQRLFASRTRDEIKRKFKREERLNQAFIDKILSKTLPIDLSIFVYTDSDYEDSDSAQKGDKDSKTDRKNLKRKRKRAFVGSDDEQGDHIVNTINSVINRAMNDENSTFSSTSSDASNALSKQAKSDQTVSNANTKMTVPDTHPQENETNNKINSNVYRPNDDADNANKISHNTDNDNDEDDDEVEVIYDVENDLIVYKRNSSESTFLETMSKEPKTHIIDFQQISSNDDADKIVIFDLNSNQPVVYPKTSTADMESKLIFVADETNKSDFQVHLLTSSEQTQKPTARSEISITKTNESQIVFVSDVAGSSAGHSADNREFQVHVLTATTSGDISNYDDAHDTTP